MKKFATAVVLAALISAPAGAARFPEGGYASWAECVAGATALDSWSTWSFTCVQNSAGTWNIVWGRDESAPKGKRTR